VQIKGIEKGDLMQVGTPEDKDWKTGASPEQMQVTPPKNKP
jgi:hypothetical protein